MTETIKTSYPLKVWINTLVLAPTIYMVATFFTTKNASLDLSAITFIGIAIALSSAFSLPTFAVYLLAFWQLSQLKIAALIIKFSLCVIAISGLAITFYFLGENIFRVRSPFYITFPTSYMLSILIAGLSFRIKKKI